MSNDVQHHDLVSIAPQYYALFSGFALFISDYPVHVWPLHFVALVPLLLVLLKLSPNRGLSTLLGLSFASSYAGPLLLSAGLAPPVIVAAATGFVMWTIAIPCMHFLLHRGNFLGPIAAAGTICLFELFQWHMIPIFGTAQCFARVTSQAPALIQFAAHTGLIGVLFVLVWSQVLISQVVMQPRNGGPYVTLACLLAVVGAINWQRWNRPLNAPVRVAAVSWSQGTQLTLSELCNKALAAEAKVIVTPETGFVLQEDEAEQSLARIVEQVKDSGLMGAIGIFRYDLRKNQILFVDSNGLKCVYEKSHLIPFLENYNPGNFSLMDIDWFNVRCGGMICQDDNFTDIARGYAQQGTSLMLVPTNDWAPIRGYHLDSSRMRAIECGYAIVRSATGGVSATISPRGEVLGQVDNTATEGISIVSTELPLGDGVPTTYSKYGDLPVGVVSLLAVVLALGVRPRRKVRTSIPHDLI